MGQKGREPYCNVTFYLCVDHLQKRRCFRIGSKSIIKYVLVSGDGIFKVLGLKWENPVHYIANLLFLWSNRIRFHLEEQNMGQINLLEKILI
jgi:hypothetical protein